MASDTANPPPELPAKGIIAAVIGLFFLCTLVVYGTSLRNDFVRWDDGLLIYENPAIRHITPATLKTIFTSYDPELYIPLTFFTYQIDYQIGGIHAFVYHLQNLFWHTLNALLVAWLGLLMLRRRWLALAMGLLFALHPLHTEAVAWAAARKDVLSTFFFLSSLIAYWYATAEGKKKLLLLSVGLFTLGLFSKVLVITLPLVLLLIDDLRGRKWSKTQLLEKWPYSALAIIFGIVAVIGKKQQVLSHSLIGPMMIMAGKSTWFYVGKFFWPARLSVLYPFSGVVSLASPVFFLPMLGIALVGAAALYLRRFTREIFFGLAFYFLTLIPTFTNSAKGGDFYVASDRYAYIPSIGLLFLLMFLVGEILSSATRHQDRVRLQRIFGTVLISVLCVFGVLSNAQAAVWQNTETLFRHVLALSPNSSLAHNNMGNVYRRQGQLDEAIAEFKAALADGKTDAIASQSQNKHVEMHNNLGAVYRKQGKFDLALAEYQASHQLNPQSSEVYFGRGLTYAAMGQDDKALADYDKALMIEPTYPDVYLDRGALLVSEGKVDQGIADYRKVLKLQPDFAQANFNLGVALEQQGKNEEALAAYRAAIVSQPDYMAARVNLGALLYQEGKVDLAKVAFQDMLKIDPKNETALSALQQMGE